MTASKTTSMSLPESVYQGSLDCVHCGMCLSSCPTYLATGRENSSPRGRIYLMRGVAEGRIALGDVVEEESYLCLGCLACETACPSGVPYGSMLEQTRSAVTKAGLHQGGSVFLEKFLLRSIVPRQRRLRFFVSLLGWIQRLGLDRMVLPLLPESLRRAHSLMPEVPRSRERLPLPEFVAAQGERRGRVALFTGCIMSEIFGQIHRDTLSVLSHNGFDVVVPRNQICCGALQAHAGDLEFAQGLAKHNADLFSEMEIDALVVNSAGCGSAMRQAGEWLGERGDMYASRVRDVSEFLDEVGLRPPTVSVKTRVCYDDPCHLVHGQGVSEAPRALLRQVPELEILEHTDAFHCCGAAGTYNLTHPEMSAQVLARKIDSLEVAGPDVIATGNPGCIMQLRSGLKERNLDIAVVHPIELLAASYGSLVPGLD